MTCHGLTVVVAAGTDQCFKRLRVAGVNIGVSDIILTCDRLVVAAAGTDQRFKRLRVDGVNIGVSVWDTAGQDRFQSLTPMYYRGAQGVVYGEWLICAVLCYGHADLTGLPATPVIMK